jgi:hypothetical protein
MSRKAVYKLAPLGSLQKCLWVSSLFWYMPEHYIVPHFSYARRLSVSSAHASYLSWLAGCSVGRAVLTCTLVILVCILTDQIVRQS